MSLCSASFQLSELTTYCTVVTASCTTLYHTEAGGLQALGIRQAIVAVRGLVGVSVLSLLNLIALVCAVLLV